MDKPSSSMDQSSPSEDTLFAHAEWVQGVVRAMVRDEHLAQDIAQDAMEAGLHAGSKKIRDPRAWLMGVVRNLRRLDARSGVRRRNTEQRKQGITEEPSSAELLARLEVQQIVAGAVMELPDPFRSVLILRFYEGAPIRTIAARRHIDRRKAENQVRGGLTLLRQRLKGRLGDAWTVAVLPLALPATASAMTATAVGLVGAVSAKVLFGVAVCFLALVGYNLWGEHGNPSEVNSNGSDQAAAIAAASTERSALKMAADGVVEEREEVRDEAVQEASSGGLQTRVLVRSRIDGKTQPLPDAMVELLAVEVTEDGEEKLGSVLLAVQADSAGQAAMLIPTDRPVALQTRFPGMLSQTTRMKDETIERLRLSESPEVKIDVFPGSCVVRVSGQVKSLPSGKQFDSFRGGFGLYVRVSVFEPPEQITPRANESIRTVSVDEEGRFELTLSAPSGQQLFCAVYSRGGFQREVQGSGRQIPIDGIWECHFELDASEFVSVYTFRLESEASVGPGDSRFMARLFDAATGGSVESVYFIDHTSNADVHSLRIPAQQELILRIDHYLLGFGERRLTPKVVSSSQVSPDVLKLDPLAHVVVREADFPGKDLGELHVSLTFRSGAAVSCDLIQDESDPSHWVIGYPMGSNLAGFRIGDRLFETNLASGKQYFLGAEGVRELPVDITSATMVVDEWQYLGRVNMIRVTHRGLVWGLFSVSASGANSAKMNVDLPIGLVSVELWDGVKSGSRSREYEVGVGSAPLVLPAY
jgi:DNA-directed RNA polymerase specialized sigma24 family protein